MAARFRSLVSLAIGMLAVGLLGGFTRPVAISGNAGDVPALVRPEPVRLCGTNSSRSRRCNFAHRRCLDSGRGAAQCEQALAICRSCIDQMTACNRDTAVSCHVCFERYDSCMGPWRAMIGR